MRLSEYQLEVIKRSVDDSFGEHSAVFLFGSRVNDQAKGGDIDLFIETTLEKSKAYQAKMQLFTALQRQLGEQKIDIVVQALDDESLPIYQEARTLGIKL